MAKRRFRPCRDLRWLMTAALVGLMLATRPALAHQFHVFAYAEGNSIVGEAYVRGGNPVQGARVVALDPSGQQLAVATTDQQGRFAFELTAHCDYRLVVDAGEGHVAEYTVLADELPGGLPNLGPPDESLRKQIDAIDRQIKALRRDLHEYRNQRQWQDVLGAVGYILGIMGLAFYFLGVRRKEKGRRGRD